MARKAGVQQVNGARKITVAAASSSTRLASTSATPLTRRSAVLSNNSIISRSFTSTASLSADADVSASSIADADADSPLNAPRDGMDYDVVVVGAGPAGLSAAIRLKQQAAEKGQEINVCVVEKGAEVGSHILSGNVFDPRALDELLPGWREEADCPVRVPVKSDKLFFLTATGSIPLPVPPTLHNEGNFIISLSQLVRWLGSKAEGLGVEIYPGFAASEVLYDENGAVRGIATKDVGIGKDGKPKDTFARGMELRGRQTLFAEGTRGSLSELVMDKFALRRGVDPQTYGLGIKEIWEILPENFRPGTVQHTLGFPSPSDTWSGSFLYHFAENKVLIGNVVGLDYSNTNISPYGEMQKLKTHPLIAAVLKGGKCLEYGARVINEGGLQSIPKLTFPGGMLVGCAAGFLNVPRIKGSHTAMKSGMVAADSIIEALAGSTAEEALPSKELVSFSSAMERSWVYAELRAVRNYHPAFHKFGGLYGFMAYSGLQAYLFRGREPWTFRNSIPDHMRTKPASECSPIAYPRPDGVLTFDLLTNLQRSAVKHTEDQPSHLKVRKGMESIPASVSWAKFRAPETRFCPARVYEMIVDESLPLKEQKPRLQINHTNCVHCKSCAIKTPELYIDWTVPEGGGGPNYQGM